MTAIAEHKLAMRQEFRRHRRAMPERARRAADARIRRHLAAMPELRAATAVAAYYPADGEPDLRPLLMALLADGKTCYFPKAAPDGTYRLAPLSPASLAPFEARFCRGRFGIPEPRARFASPPADSLIWLIPGVAFDRQGHRLGRGGGFYDRLLRDAPGLRIAPAYQTQIATAVPAEPHDEPVHRIVTESGLLRCLNHPQKGSRS